MAHGTCLCGALQYEITTPVDAMLHCHCSMCRKHHGTPFATLTLSALEGFAWIAGEDGVVHYRSSPNGTRHFCGTCGSVAPGTIPSMGMVFAPAANLRGELGIEPQMHVFVGSKAPWHAITDGLPQHAAYPPGVGAQPVERPIPATREGVVSGSCLCGDIAYEMTGKPTRMVNCHCDRCHLGKSAAHATNVFCAMDDFRWTRGESSVKEYKVPGARFHTASFCSRCGSKVPRISAERGIAIVPSGSLDTDPGMRPTADIFVAYKAPWFPLTDGLPQFPEAAPA